MTNTKNNRSKTGSIMYLCLLVVATACSWFVAIYDGIFLVLGGCTINNIFDAIGFLLIIIGPIAFTISAFKEADNIEKKSSQKEEA